MHTRLIEIYVALMVVLSGAEVFADVSDKPVTLQSHYEAAKVVYDVSSHDPGKLSNILDRVSMLQNLYGNDPFEAAIVVVIHDGAIPFFVKSNNNMYRELVSRARSLTMGDVIKFRMCEASARMQGFNPEDVHDFIAMVPMADAEIVKLQHEDYALMR